MEACKQQDWKNELGIVWHVWKRLRYDLKTRTSNVDFGSKVYSLLSRDQQDWAVQDKPQGGRDGVGGDLSREPRTRLPISELTKRFESLLNLAFYTLSKVLLIFASWLKYSICVGQWW